MEHDAKNHEILIEPTLTSNLRLDNTMEQPKSLFVKLPSFMTNSSSVTAYALSNKTLEFFQKVDDKHDSEHILVISGLTITSVVEACLISILVFDSM